jgi:hypothetical protein
MTPYRVRALLRITLDSADYAAVSEGSKILGSIPEEDWPQLLKILDFHRLVPIVAEVLKARGLEDKVPQRFYQQMLQIQRLSAMAQLANFFWMEKILDAMAREGITPVVWKGIALVNLFYPSVSSRPIGDLDLFVERAEWEKVDSIVTSLGFQRVENGSMLKEATGVEAVLDVADACNYRKKPENVVLDIHHRCRLFEGQGDIKNLTTGCKPRFLKVDTILVFEPNAMLVHLNRHRSAKLGYFLPWILDIALLLKTCGSQLDPERLERLLSSRRYRFWVLRTLSFLMHELDVELPVFLRKAAESVRPYTIAEVLRSCRIRPWGLPRPIGWTRLLAKRVGYPLSNVYPDLQRGDLFLWASDRFKEIVTGFTSQMICRKKPF